MTIFAHGLGVAKGTGMGYFSPASTVSRGAMAAFITRALAHTTARPAGVTIQSDGPGEAIISVRDANFHPVANAAVDVFSAAADKVDEAFNADGSCNKARVTGVGGNAKECEIDALDAVTGLSGDYELGSISVNPDAGGTTVWAWTGDSGDKVEDGGEGLASINLTKTAPVNATGTKITTDLGENVERAAFGSTVTVTIQLVGDVESNRADAVPPTDGVSYNVVIRSTPERDQASDDLASDLDPVTTGATVTTQTVAVDASGKGTFTITAADPDPNNADDPESGSVDWVTVTYAVTTTATGVPVVGDISDAAADGMQTIRFSDAPSLARRASITPTAKYLAAPTSGGSASNVVTVKVVDQYGKPVRAHLVRLDSNHSTDPPSTPADTDLSTFPVARRTDSSGTVRIGYSYKGTGSVESLNALTKVTPDGGGAATFPRINAGATDADADFYWVSPAAAGDVTAADVRVADVESNTVVIGGDGSTSPQLLVYDDNDQFIIGAENSTMAAFEEQLAKKDTGDADTVGVVQYNPTDASAVARFTLTVNS